MSKWQKFLPFLLPLLAVLIIVFLVWNWYRGQVGEPVDAPNYIEGIAIENLSQEELAALEALRNQTVDHQTLILTGALPYQGEVRYIVNDDRLLLTVIAGLSDSDAGYRLWFVGDDEQVVFTQSRPFVLGKGSHTVSLVLPADVLPLSLYVLPEGVTGAAVRSEYVLQGVISQ